ncbi:unnamed protein product [Pleuronectes platessa]|uniref:Uncharacterized protein n=1 Tax=Pleuronectes platessa TaxID=8262 RepID=A0A9N7U0G9_PLEPL|nr:unnamed protein product [Pleuronectes platessa]
MFDQRSNKNIRTVCDVFLEVRFGTRVQSRKLHVHLSSEEKTERSQSKLQITPRSVWDQVAAAASAVLNLMSPPLPPPSENSPTADGSAPTQEAAASHHFALIGSCEQLSTVCGGGQMRLRSQGVMKEKTTPPTHPVLVLIILLPLTLQENLIMKTHCDTLNASKHVKSGRFPGNLEVPVSPRRSIGGRVKDEAVSHHRLSSPGRFPPEVQVLHDLLSVSVTHVLICSQREENLAGEQTGAFSSCRAGCVPQEVVETKKS